MLVSVLNAFLFMFVSFLLLKQNSSRICNVFFIIISICNYCIISEKLP